MCLAPSLVIQMVFSAQETIVSISEPKAPIPSTFGNHPPTSLLFLPITQYLHYSKLVKRVCLVERKYCFFSCSLT